MLQQRTALDALADLPKSQALEKARAALEEARQLEQAALVTFSRHCARLRTADRWVQNDADAKQSEAEAIKASAAARLAHQEAEAAKRAHGAVLARHFSKHEAAALELIVEPMRDARDAARKIVHVLEAAERDGGNPSYQLNKAKRALRLLNDALGSFQ